MVDVLRDAYIRLYRRKRHRKVIRIADAVVPVSAWLSYGVSGRLHVLYRDLKIDLNTVAQSLNLWTQERFIDCQ